MPTYSFTVEELILISRLPPSITKFQDQYPLDVLNTARIWHEHKQLVPLAIKDPELIEVYYNDTTPAIIYYMGKLKKYTLTPTEFKANSIAVQIDDEWGYIELEGEVLINRIEDITLPKVVVDPVVVMEAVLALYRR